ncbi:CC0125/CC1285 family lipoprotein [Aeromonas caviae]|nr:hypothetical protein [Aeromonas caviae]BCM78249.1 hypothetical protein KAM329_48010 [Aeromonas caviae]BDN90443.1 hypothetical protein KAM471c_42580 [Aeromonas caviae]GJA34516.1 hypothetical protein KAM341_41940 [Aeromonas caviae]GJB05140.1 hypothetical protein KAM360_40830 [Aeromonas caviae]GJC25311.1 hypothetical protein KAM329D_42920 [Aeromonas caviae]
MRMKLTGLLCCVALTGCATAYQPYSYFGGGGYSDVQLAENVFQVTVEANGFTTSTEAADLALLRSADLTLERGFKYFIIGSTADHSYSAGYTTPSTTTLNATSYGNTIYGTAQTTGGQTYVFNFPTPSMTITCFSDQPALNGTVYDAAITSRSLRAKLGI